MNKQKFSAIILVLLFVGVAHATDVAPTEQIQNTSAIAARGSHALSYPTDTGAMLLARMNVLAIANAVAVSPDPLKVDIIARNAEDLGRVEKWFAGELAKTKKHNPVRVQGFVQPNTKDLKIDVALAQQSN